MTPTRDRPAGGSDKFLRLLGLIALLAGGIVLVLVALRELEHQANPRPGPPDGARAAGPDPARADSSPTSAPAGQPTTAQRSVNRPAPRGPIEAVLEDLRAASPIAAHEALDALRQRLGALGASEVGGNMRDFLATGGDAATGLEFTVIEGGNLSGWPTLRVALLDWWGGIDVQAAAEFGRTNILQRKDSADEWAVSLRNIARASGQPASDLFLKSKTSELLRYEPWVNTPTRGFLHGFDLVVACRNLEDLPTLETYMSHAPSPRVARAAYLATDRLGLSWTEEMLERLTADTSLLDQLPEIRAELLARGDVASRTQRQAIESYLAANTLSDRECAKFVAAFPLHSRTLGHNLVTTDTVPSLQEMARRDLGALVAAAGWLTDPRLAGRAADIRKLVTRLEERVASARRGGLLPPSSN